MGDERTQNLIEMLSSKEGLLGEYGFLVVVLLALLSIIIFQIPVIIDKRKKKSSKKKVTKNNSAPNQKALVALIRKICREEIKKALYE